MSKNTIEEYIENLKINAKKSGYYLNPDEEFLYDLGDGLLTNKERYGYESCPCRRSDGAIDKDMDIICPCDYRDTDLDEYGTCYCGLYVSENISNGKDELAPIPDRRKSFSTATLKYPIWRCKVCGYLCARNNPPEKCPICKIQRERFERLL